MKTVTFGDYMDAKRQMKAKPTLDNILKYIEIVTILKGRLPVYHYDLANMYLKRCP
jgi:hypothetical protein